MYEPLTHQILYGWADSDAEEIENGMFQLLLWNIPRQAEEKDENQHKLAAHR
jgi:hypothetical protein